MSTENLATTGEAMLKAGNTAGAERIALRMLDDDPQGRDGLLLLCLVRDKQADYTATLQLSEQLIALDMTDDDARVVHVMAFIHLRRFDEANAAINAFKKDFPDSKHTKLLRMMLSMKRVDVKSSRADTDAMRAEKGECLEVNLAEAAVALGEGQNRKAYSAAQSALEKDPFCGTSHILAATAAFWSLRPGLAQRHARQALKYAPEDADMPGFIRMGYARWFPPFALAYGIVMLHSALSTRITVFGAVPVMWVLSKLFVAPFAALLHAAALPVNTFLNLTIASFIYLCIELYVMPGLTKTRKTRDISLENY